jgi:hypothetical protein
MPPGAAAAQGMLDQWRDALLLWIVVQYQTISITIVVFYDVGYLIRVGVSMKGSW